MSDGTSWYLPVSWFGWCNPQIEESSMNNYKVELSIITEADSPEQALDDVRSAKWTWTVTNLETNESVELDA